MHHLLPTKPSSLNIKIKTRDHFFAKETSQQTCGARRRHEIRPPVPSRLPADPGCRHKHATWCANRPTGMALLNATTRLQKTPRTGREREAGGREEEDGLGGMAGSETRARRQTREIKSEGADGFQRSNASECGAGNQRADRKASEQKFERRESQTLTLHNKTQSVSLQFYHKIESGFVEALPRLCEYIKGPFSH